MDAVFRDNQFPYGSLARAAVVLMAALLLAACSSVQTEAPTADLHMEGGTIHGAVLAESASAPISTTSLSSQVAEFRFMRAPGSAAAYPSDRVLVQYREDTGFGTLSGGEGGTGRVETVPVENGVENAVEHFGADPAVALVSPDYYVYPTGFSGDPYLDFQWSLEATGVPATWSLGAGEAPVVVAVIDTGFDLRHEDLAGRYLPGYDFCANSDCSASDGDPSAAGSTNWHGTHVAGIIGAIGNNGIGIRGVADGAAVQILPIKIFNEGGQGGSSSLLIRALRWAAGLPVAGAPTNPYPAQIINLSLAGDFHSSVLQSTIDEVRRSGSLVVASTGNDGLDRVMSPAAASGVVGVGSSNSSFRRSCFSNHSDGKNGPGTVDILAPGGEGNGSRVSCGIEAGQAEGVLSALPGDRYGNGIGTSMSAPIVSAAAAVILSQDPSLSVPELEARLLESAYFEGSYMNPDEYGAGVLRTDRALGLRGPGDQVLVELRGKGTERIEQTLAIISPHEQATSFAFRGLTAGEYDLAALDLESGSLLTSSTVSLRDENSAVRANLDFDLRSW